MASEKLIRASQVDAELAKNIVDTTSLTRTALAQVLPASAGSSASVAQFVKQTTGGSWPNPVRDSSVGGRIYVALVDASKRPTLANGLTTGDVLFTPAGVLVATFVPSVGAAQWQTWTGSGTGTTDPGTPGTPGDTSTPSATSTPFALLSSTGTWSTPAGTTLVQALSDTSASTTATGVPVSGAGAGVSLVFDMRNFQHASGNALSVTLWGASSTTAGDVTVTVGSGASQYAAPMSKAVTGTAGDITFTWPAAAQLSLPAATWQDVEVTVARTTGGLTLGRVTLQSQPATVDPPAGTDPLDPVSLRWASTSVWYSNCSSAPLAKANLAIAAYVKAQASTGALRLDVYSDAAPIRMVPASTPRVNVTPPATSGRGNVALLHTTDGKGAFDAVPIPSDMPAPANVFKTAVIGSVETQQVWEFLGLVKTAAGGWAAEWGGRIDSFPTNGGVFPASQGYTGSGLAWAAAAVKVTEARDAVAGNTQAIQHALGLNLVYDTARSTFCWPATRSDGTSSDPGAPHMGQRLRLKATADLSGCTPIGKAIGEAMKRYGAVVLGGADKISIVAESGATEQARTGTDPWGALLAGKSVDNVLSGIPLDQLEVVSPGWGSPTWTAEGDVVVPVDPPVTPPTGGARRAIYMPADVKWLSGASCRAIEDSADGMASAFATWRGEPCYMARTWADQGGPNGNNDPQLWPLVNRFKNWHASMDEGPGFFGRNGQDMAGAARGDYVSIWRQTLTTYRNWWASRRNPAQVNAFFSPAHEFNGNWYPWSVNSGNYQNFITAWKRLREVQLQVFPESLLCLNANAQSIGANMDWRRMVAGYAEGKTKDFVDVGGVDYYNFTSVTSDSSWQTHINRVDQWGGPWGLEKHRQFWESQGLAMQIPEWSNHKPAGDSPLFAQKMNEYMRTYSGTGPGRICADALFNLSSGYEGQYAVTGDTVGSPQFAAKYREMVWGK